VEALLAERLDELLAAGQLPELKALQEAFAPRTSVSTPEVCVSIPAASAYDALLVSEALPA
jgi:hypothetical protein